jgi:threonylcarbamoyladenosine tRNA methylthiotransferase CDKAL1
VRVHVEAYGCAQSQGEGAAIARALVAGGHVPISTAEGSDVTVLVTCGVIGATEARMVRRWRAVSALAPRVVVTGCLVPLRTGLFDGPGLERTRFVPIREQDRIPELLRDGTPPAAPSPAPGPEIPPTVVEEVVLAQGCTSACSYCFSRLARGRLTSVPAETVVARLEAAHARGAREVRLTGLDTAAWGEDLPGRPNLADLLFRIGERLHDLRVRVGMMSPQSVQPFLDEYLEALEEPRVYRFLHLPVQSGSDRILGLMRRGYTADAFLRIVATARARFPELHLATDAIVGYPTEEEDDHRRTETVLETAAPETVNVTRFSARPGTPAARAAPVGSRVAKQRSRALAALRGKIARRRLEPWIGREVVARVTEYGPMGSSVARLPNYLAVALESRPPLGSDLRVRIEGARSTYLLGRATGAGV